MQRITSLDGLRGIAALIVVVYHATFVPLLLNKPVDKLGGIEILFSLTPIRIFTAGGEAVHVFFVLSGIVLGFVASSSKFKLIKYYKSRFVRLYFPVIPAVAISYLTSFFLYSLNPKVKMPESLSAESVIKDLTLLAGNGSTLGVLWSLTWEVWFSILLPVFVFIAAKKLPLLQVCLCLVSIMLGDALNKGALQYLPMFLIGVVISKNWGRLEIAFAKIQIWRKLNFLLLMLITAVAAITSQYWIASTFRPMVSPELLKIYCYPIEFLGVIVVVLLSGFHPKMIGFLNLKPIKWLGMISFSLYLIHSPVVEFIEYWSWDFAYLEFPLAIILSVIAGWLFFKLIEKPSHNLARKLSTN